MDHWIYVNMDLWKFISIDQWLSGLINGYNNKSTDPWIS
jgi:hypothetical protein